MMKVPYFPGCSLKTSAKHFEESAIDVAKELGIELVELQKWNCCGTVYSLTADDLMHHVASMRNLVWAQELGKQLGTDKLVTMCAMCYNTLAQVNDFAKKRPEDLKTVNDFMDNVPNYEGKVEVKHLLTFLKEMGFANIVKKAKRKLNGLKVASYYGCLLLRPENVKIDDKEKPAILRELLEPLGAKVVDMPFGIECCGSYHTVDKRDIVAEKAYLIINDARENGADAIVLSCPLCEFNLDERQKLVKERHPDFVEMPVFYFTELVALAMGKQINLNAHYVNPRALLEKHNLL